MLAPADDDFLAQCMHGNMFNLCAECMRAAGLSDAEVEARLDKAHAHLHAQFGNPPTPRVK